MQHSNARKDSKCVYANKMNNEFPAEYFEYIDVIYTTTEPENRTLNTQVVPFTTLPLEHIQ
jgi:hypothetical protein